NYEKGKYATIDFKYNDHDKTLTICDRQGDFDGMLKNRRFNIVYITSGHAQSLVMDHPHGKMVKYNGNIKKVKL
ncbi:DUF5110 domain-containing protein, partial [uncultured Bifidobacterium sp.]